MKKLISIILTAALLVFPSAVFFAEESGLEIDEKSFPDDSFRNYVKENIDIDSDGYLSDREIYGAEAIDVSGIGISDLNGIEYFTELKNLNCSDNEIAYLYLRKNEKLETLDCSGNKLTQLDLFYNKNLKSADCSDNMITVLDVMQSEYLEQLNCKNNRLSDILLDFNTVLRCLDCSGNELTGLDLSKNKGITFLDCSENLISQLDLKNNVLLETLICKNNSLACLDLSMNEKLSAVDAGGNKYTITVGSDGVFDLADLPGGFDVSRAGEWRGGNIEGSILKADGEAETVTYDYDMGNEKTENFSLVVKRTERTDIPVNGKNFPDTAFRNYVLEYCDIDGNNFLSQEEINNTVFMNISFLSVFDLKGIEYFTALQQLMCNSNGLITMDLSKNTELKWLECSDNEITHLDLSRNAKLEYFSGSGNRITNMVLNDNSSFQYFNISENIYSIYVDESNIFDLSVLPGSFDAGKVPSVIGGVFDAVNNTLTVNEGTDTVIYAYDLGGGRIERLFFEITRTKTEPGDVNKDGKIDIKDATEIQKYLASSAGSSENFDVMAADVNSDGRITVLDVTAVQLILAENN